MISLSNDSIDMKSRNRDFISGYCDGVVEGQIVGWIINHDRANVLESVFVETDLGLKLEYKTVVYNLALVSKLGRYEKFGFAIPVNVLPKYRHHVRLLDRNGTLLENGLLHLKQETTQNVLHDHCAVFMHIPKTAGTALCSAFQKQIPASGICLLYADSSVGLNWNEASLLPPLQRRAFRLLIGHFYFGFDSFLNQRAKYYTFIREPMARLRSHYWHYRAVDKTYLNVAGESVPLSVVVQEGLTDEFDNLQTRMIAGVGPDITPVGKVSGDILNMAYFNIENSFAFIGLTEHIDDHARLMFETMRLQPVAIDRENEASRWAVNVDDTDFKSIDWGRVEENNKYDIELYRRVASCCE